MTKVLVTGGTGMLGRELKPRLLAAGYTVRIMSRRAPRPGEDADVEWAQVELASGAGLAEAMQDVDVIVHAASNALKRKVDVQGTKLLLEHAREAGVSHLVYISIVGIEQISFGYYQDKLAAERLIETSGVSWTIVRATQFHSFVDRILSAVIRLPVALLPTGWQFQVISDGNVAEQLLNAVKAGPSGRLPDIGGPRIMSLDEMARQWMKARGMRRPIVHLPVPGGLSAGFRAGQNTMPQDKTGQETWAEWLQTKYGHQRKNASDQSQSIEEGVSV